MKGTRDIDYVTFEIWDTDVCGVVVAVNEHRMNFVLAHSIIN